MFGDKSDYPVFFSFDQTGSGTVEGHMLERSTMKRFLYHDTSNMPQVDPALNDIRIAKLNRTGAETPILVQYQNTGSGMIEFHEWNSGLKTWRDHKATNHPVISPTDNTVEFADIDGDGKDEAILVGLRNTGSGRIEFHTWHRGFTSWRSHAASNQPTI